MNILSPLINIVFGIAEFFLGFRFLLRLFSANPGAPFVEFIYQTSQPLLYPFRGIFPTPVVEGGFVLELTTLFAIITYATIAYLLIALLNVTAAAAEERH